MHINSAHFICDKCKNIFLLSGEEIKENLFQSDEIDCKIFGCNGTLDQLDEYVVRHINKLNKFSGIESSFSCSGHIHDKGSYTPYIKFNVKDNELYEKVLKIAKHSKLKVNLENEYDVSFEINESGDNITLYLSVDNYRDSFFRNEKFWTTRLYLWDALLEDFILGLECYFDDGVLVYEE